MTQALPFPLQMTQHSTVRLKQREGETEQRLDLKAGIEGNIFNMLGDEGGRGGGKEGGREGGRGGRTDVASPR